MEYVPRLSSVSQDIMVSCSFHAQVTYPLCTIASKPRLPEHCIEYVRILQWSKEKPFGGRYSVFVMHGSYPQIRCTLLNAMQITYLTVCYRHWCLYNTYMCVHTHTSLSKNWLIMASYGYE